MRSADYYIRGTNLVAKYNYKNAAKSEYTYYTQNAHGDVANLTNSNGEVTKKYTYDAFGVEKSIVENDANAFRYCGEYYDTETATVYLRARNYDPSTGRFISRDSFAGKQGDPLSLNLYTYCANNPIINVDPDGHFSLTGWFKNRCDGWKDGIDIMHSMGRGWSATASYCEGVVDNGGAIINSVAHPIDTVSTALSDFKSDPLKNNLVTQTVTGIGEFYTGLWNASSNGDWNSVAYSLGGATTNVAAVGVTGKLGAKVAGKVAPNGINFGFSGCAYALAGGGTWVSAIAISSSQVVSAGAVASAAVAGSNVIVAESSGGSSGGRMTAKEATKAAEELGFRKINDKSHGQPVYTDGKSYITPDVDSHNGGAWKMARSVKDLRSKSTRSGTYDANLNRIGD